MTSFFARSSGLLLHLTSLPAMSQPHGNGLPGSDGVWAGGDIGSGDLGPSAYEFVRYMAAASQKWWQVLPCSPTGYGFSPYQSPSAFAGNPLLVSPALLVRDGLLKLEEWHDAANSSSSSPKSGRRDQVDFESSAGKRMELLRIAFRRFQNQRQDLHASLEEYWHHNHTWLYDHTLFTALKSAHQDKAWNTWEEPLVRRHQPTMDAWRDKLRTTVEFEAFIQFLFDRQWKELREYASTNGVNLIGDIPIFVAMDSADVWAQQHLFELDNAGNPYVLAGVPPDYFSETGQLWGNPLYRWDIHKQTHYDWWMRRVGRILEQCDLIRIDHFRGFEAYWEVPGDRPDAIVGEWKPGPRDDFFEAMRGYLGGGELPVIAEDLGLITEEVHQLRDRFHFPGMKIIQFGFVGAKSSSLDLPHNYPTHCVAYTGTHDNDTVIGWFNSKPGQGNTSTQEQIDAEKSFALRYLNCPSDQIHLGMIRAVWSSVAAIAIAPIQDLLGLDAKSRMNTPGTASGNWTWRCPQGLLDSPSSSWLADITDVYGRSE